MAITTTPLGFQKPDGNESLRNGDNVIAANAQKAEDAIQADRGRLAAIESVNTAQGSRLTAAETSLTSATARVTAVESGNVTRDTRITTAESTLNTTANRVTAVENTTANQGARLASVESAAFVGGGLLMEDPTDPGFFLVGAP